MAKHVTLQQLGAVVGDITNKADQRFQQKGDVLSYIIKELGTAEAGYLKTYQLFSVDASDPAVETPVGAKINIPKDFLVKSATLSTVTAEDKASGGKFENDENFEVGDKYIDLVVNVKSGTATDEHIYLNVKDLVDIYTAGNAIEISGANVISVKVDSANARGLSVGANGLALALVTPNVTTYVSAGEGAKYVPGTTYYTDNTGTTTVNTSDFEEGVTDVSSYYVASVAAGGAGAMSAADKTKLDSFTEATASDIQAIIDGIWPAA